VIVGQRRIEGATTVTPGARPLPLTGRPLTDTPVVVKNDRAALRAYPEVCISSKEPLAEDEMRLICTGSGNPMVRRGRLRQAG
jgi:hypothetical protein